MNWGMPEWLVGLWVLPVLIFLLVLALRSRSKALGVLGPLVGSRVGINSRSRARRRLVLLLFSVGLIVVALAQPRFGFRWSELKQEGTNIVVVLDTSLSMDAQDVSPSRMERAHREIFDLVDNLRGDRVGLVLFSGGAYTRMPLSLDYHALRTMVRRSTTATLKSQGSDLGAAIRTAVEVSGEAGESDRAIIIISDGEDQIGNAVAAAQAAREVGAHIFTVGVGTTDGAPIPLKKGGFKKSKNGDVVLTKLGEQTLQEIAAVGGGAYVRSVAGSADMRAIYVDEILGKLKRADQTVRREKIWTERFQWPLGLAWLMGLLAFAVRGRGLPVALALFCVLGSSPAQAGSETIDGLTAAQVANPDDLDLAERLGAALFQAGRFNEAEDVLGSVSDRSKDQEARARARYNSGLSAYRGGRLTEAVEAWQRVLQDNPEHAQAQKNASAVQAEIQKRLGEEPPPQDGEQDPEQSEDGEQGSDTGAPDDGTREPPPEPPEGGDTGAKDAQPPENQPSEEDQGDTGSSPAAPTEVREMTMEQAERMFESVQEGDPRVVIDPGSRGGNEW
jgi:Ca-activated chloride channel family protein